MVDRVSVYLLYIVTLLHKFRVTVMLRFGNIDAGLNVPSLLLNRADEILMTLS